MQGEAERALISPSNEELWGVSPLERQPGYDDLLASGDWTCSIARFRGTMTGPMKTADGKEIPPTGKGFDLEFYAIALWDDGQIGAPHQRAHRSRSCLPRDPRAGR